MKIIIPARKGSKGFPLKNRKLFKYTANIIPDVFKHLTYVVTDDEVISKESLKYGFNIIDRTPEVSRDVTSTKATIQYAIDEIGIENEDVIVLYLTYPERKWDHVDRAYLMFRLTRNQSSLLCKKKIDTSPFLMLKQEAGDKGSQLFYHDLYRRQDYPTCFEISHYICIFNSNRINNLNNNMYNNNTVYYNIDNVIDVDEKKDLDKFEAR